MIYEIKFLEGFIEEKKGLLWKMPQKPLLWQQEF